MIPSLSSSDPPNPGAKWSGNPDSAALPSHRSVQTSRCPAWLQLTLCVLIVAALLGVALVRLQAHRAKELADPERARAHGNPMPVRTAIVEERTNERVIGATGVTEPSQMAIVRFGQSRELESSLVVARVLAGEGQQVEAGDVLVEIEDTLLVQTLRHREAALAAAQQQLQALRQLKERGAASGFEVRSAELEVDAARIDRELAAQSLERCQVTSPIDGYLDVVHVVPGALIDASTEMTKVYNLDPIHMRVDLPQERIGDVHRGSEVEVVVDSFPQESFTGRVIRIAPQVDPETRVLAVVVEVPNPDHRIKGGVSGFARFKASETAVIVPQLAITQIERRAMVFVVEQGRARIREITTGPLADIGMKQVVQGLEPGEEVVVYGQQYLSDGDRVNPDWRRWTRRS